jgi:hypothetical protein
MPSRICTSWIAAAMVVVLVQPGVLAQLKFTLHTELKRVEGAPPSEWSALIGALSGKVIPPGGVDHIVLVNDKAMRMEQKHAFAGLAAGTMTLYRDGQQFGFDPASKTFWKSQPFSATEMKDIASRKPDVKVVRTTEFQTINGLRAQRVTTTIVMKITPAEGGPTIPGMPNDLTLTFDAWVTDAVALPAGFVPLIDQRLLAQLGVAQVNSFTDNKLMLRGIAKLDFIPDLQIEMSVKDLAKEAIPAALFEIPAGFREVRGPVNRGGRP